MHGRGDPYIMPHERRILTVRQHPLVVLGRDAALTLLGLAAAFWLTIATAAPWQAVWLLWGALALRFAGKMAEWAETCIILTNMRILLITGFLVKRVSLMPLVKVVDMSYERPFLGQFFNYGRLLIESAGPSHPLRRIDSIPHPEEVYMTICSMLFADPAARDDE